MTSIVNLAGKRGLVVGIANEHGVVTSCTTALRQAVDFDELLDKVRERTPAQRLVEVDDVGRVAALLAGDAGSALTGSVVYADGGFHTMA